MPGYSLWDLQWKSSSRTDLSSLYICFTVSTLFHQCSIHVRASTPTLNILSNWQLFNNSGGNNPDIREVRYSWIKGLLAHSELGTARSKGLCVWCTKAVLRRLLTWSQEYHDERQSKTVNLQGAVCEQDLAKKKQQRCTLDQELWYDFCRKQTINRASCEHLIQLRKCACSEI
jgi:hypothetical protein